MDPLKNFNKTHPELREGEIFLANCSESDFRIMTWQTKRCGRIAYDFHGNKITYLGVYPVFIKLEELEKAGSNFNMYGPHRPVM